MESDGSAWLSISVDLGTCNDHDLEGMRALYRLLQRYGTAATWALPDPAQSPIVAELASYTGLVQHEVALLGDACWIGPQAGRTRFARQLAQRLQRAAELGLSISTLALARTQLEGHLDLLVKHRINMVRPDIHSQATRLPVSSLRYGIWQAPAACPLPQGHLCWPWKSGSAARRALRRGIARGQLIHIWIGYSQIASDLGRSLRTIERVLRRIDRARGRGLLEVQTLRQLADKLTPARSVPARRSILRAA